MHNSSEFVQRALFSASNIKLSRQSLNFNKIQLTTHSAGEGSAKSRTRKQKQKKNTHTHTQ